MKKLLLITLVLVACIACFSSCGLMNKIFPCKHKNTVTDAAVAATCTESGLTEGKHCEKCGVVTVAQTTIPAHGHTEVVNSAIAPTCTTTGLTEGKHCSVCNTVLVAQAVAPQMHDYSEWTVIVEPGCFNEGEKTRTCSICKVKENINIETLEHNFVQNEETKLFACEICDARIYAGHIYAVIDTPSHWYEAYQFCESLGGHLVTITSQYEQDLIFDMIYQGKTDNGYFEWITEEGYWLGAIKNTSGWKWITGEEFEYSNWDQKEPSNNNAEAFLGMNACGEWHNCSHTHIGSTGLKFICEWDVNITEPNHFFTEWETITEATCFGDGEQYRICTHCGLEETETIPKLQHNFIFDEAKGLTSCEHCGSAMYNGHIYKIFAVSLSWFDAYTYCQDLGGHLVTITTEEEQTFLNTYMTSQSFTSRAWIGAYSDSIKWQWVTDEEYDYTNWATNIPLPDCHNGVEFFAHLNFNNLGDWNDLPYYGDNLGLPYLICEWEA